MGWREESHSQESELAERTAGALERMGGNFATLLHLEGEALEVARANKDVLTRIEGRLVGVQRTLSAAAAEMQRAGEEHISLALRVERVEDYARTAADWPKWLAVVAALVGAAVGIAVKVL
ncbi:MAG: hypothetical protein ACE5R4_16970 [Armatimonadota bacterium]